MVGGGVAAWMGASSAIPSGSFPDWEDIARFSARRVAHITSGLNTAVLVLTSLELLFSGIVYAASRA